MTQYYDAPHNPTPVDVCIPAKRNIPAAKQSQTSRDEKNKTMKKKREKSRLLSSHRQPTREKETRPLGSSRRKWVYLGLMEREKLGRRWSSALATCWRGSFNTMKRTMPWRRKQGHEMEAQTTLSCMGMRVVPPKKNIYMKSTLGRLHTTLGLFWSFKNTKTH